MDAADLKTLVEERVNNGLLGRWYAAAKSVQVRNKKPHGVKICDRSLVLWRCADGTIKCLDDFCPHRGAPLSRGDVHDDNISCRYHGIVVDGLGTVVRVPAMPECALEGRKAVKSYSVVEARDAVFVYLPSKERPEAPPLELPEELTSDGWTNFLCMSLWDCNYRYALDNLADPMHGCYLHADSFTLAFGAKQDYMKLDSTESGFCVSRVGQQGENFDWSELILAGEATYCRLDIPYPTAGGPGGPMRIIGFVTPIDARSCYVFFWRSRQVSGLAREAWRFMYRAVFEPRHWHVLEQDREMLMALPDDARRREMLYQHDIGVSRVRQLLTRAAKSQIEVEYAGRTSSVE